MSDAKNFFFFEFRSLGDGDYVKQSIIRLAPQFILPRGGIYEDRFARAGQAAMDASQNVRYGTKDLLTADVSARMFALPAGSAFLPGRVGNYEIIANLGMIFPQVTAYEIYFHSTQSGIREGKYVQFGLDLYGVYFPGWVFQGDHDAHDPVSAA